MTEGVAGAFLAELKGGSELRRVLVPLRQRGQRLVLSAFSQSVKLARSSGVPKTASVLVSLSAVSLSAHMPMRIPVTFYIGGLPPPWLI